MVVTSRSQEIGSVYDVAEYGGALYAGTNKGLSDTTGTANSGWWKGLKGRYGA